MIKLALRSALSDRAAEGKVAVVRAWPWEIPSTREARSCLEALGLEGRVLVVLGGSDEEAYKSFRNLPAVQLIMGSELNAYDILCNDWIVFSAETLPGEAAIVEVPAVDGPAAEAEVAADQPAVEAEVAAEAEAEPAGEAVAAEEPAAAEEPTDETPAPEAAETQDEEAGDE
jgi:large subunit ribosomal protein L4